MDQTEHDHPEPDRDHGEDVGVRNPPGERRRCRKPALSVLPARAKPATPDGGSIDALVLDAGVLAQLFADLAAHGPTVSRAAVAPEELEAYLVENRARVLDLELLAEPPG